MTHQRRLLSDKYLVLKMAAIDPAILDYVPPGAMIDDGFVLRPSRDPAALRALETYAGLCVDPTRSQLLEWIKSIYESNGEREMGDTGELTAPVVARENSAGSPHWITCRNCGGQVPGQVNPGACFICPHCLTASGGCGE